MRRIGKKKEDDIIGTAYGKMKIKNKYQQDPNVNFLQPLVA